MDELNQITKMSLQPLLNDKDFAKKEKAMERLFQNAHNNLRDAFYKWRNLN
jgi:hypothetical protein